MIDARSLPEFADEYALGLLDASEVREAEDLLHSSPAFRAAMAQSRDRFLELDLLAHPVPVSESLWDRIDERLGEQQPTPELAPKPLPVANDNAVNRWRLPALSGLAASMLLAVGLGWSLMVQPEPQVIAVLLNDAGEPLVLVEDYGDTSARITPLSDFDVPAGRTMQVWTLPNKELGPVSLGLLEASHTVTLDGPVLPQPHDEQLYEITLEQAGGSPTGRPTGPILVKGFAKLPR
ncbi:anti-sigma factor [Pararhizobium sp.]|uniref:anti-sigma factor n=1 Tax=Pararhizobium sp. TaxID=1977563 RepID=UPI002722A836|nr:anti-sigma factor [Pararhizobium sp.]MDO9415246.1 anti-sigma factor [Pararhizobium sp.]